MEQSPDVGIMQFSSGVMQVVHTYFENGITFFTNLIYSAIKYCVANGDVAPFVGHNAILRWAAIQQVSYEDEDGYEKFWSESHVSEDFDMSLRLQCNGFIIRLAGWAGDGFKEGVSLTVYDELARWEKYAYGCNELLFHPIRTWLWRGPFTPLFRRFLFSNIRFTSKITIVSYIGTYYAIGAAWIMTTANYFAIGWFNGYLDKYYIDSWKVWFSLVIVFNGLGNVALAAMRYRNDEGSFIGNRKPLPPLFPHCHKLKTLLSPPKLQMDRHALHLPGRALPARLGRAALAHVRNQHDLGRHVQRSRVLQLLHRSAQSALQIQVQHALLAALHRRHDRPRHRDLHPARLDDYRFRRHLAHGYRHGEPFLTAVGAESGADDVFVVSVGGCKGGEDSACCSAQNSLFSFEFGSVGNMGWWGKCSNACKHSLGVTSRSRGLYLPPPSYYRHDFMTALEGLNTCATLTLWRREKGIESSLCERHIRSFWTLWGQVEEKEEMVVMVVDSLPWGI